MDKIFGLEGAYPPRHTGIIVPSKLTAEEEDRLWWYRYANLVAVRLPEGTLLVVKHRFGKRGHIVTPTEFDAVARANTLPRPGGEQEGPPYAVPRLGNDQPRRGRDVIVLEWDTDLPTVTSIRHIWRPLLDGIDGVARLEVLARMVTEGGV